MGRRFYETTLPDIAIALLRIAGALEKPPEAGRRYLEERERIRAVLETLANVACDGECYCRTHSGDCPDCDGCPDCLTGKARSILVSMGLV
jgi:hypothetical protein